MWNEPSSVSQVSSVKLTVSTTSVSPFPLADGIAQSGCFHIRAVATAVRGDDSKEVAVHIVVEKNDFRWGLYDLIRRANSRERRDSRIVRIGSSSTCRSSRSLTRATNSGLYSGLSRGGIPPGGPPRLGASCAAGQADRGADRAAVARSRCRRHCPTCRLSPHALPFPGPLRPQATRLRIAMLANGLAPGSADPLLMMCSSSVCPGYWSPEIS